MIVYTVRYQSEEGTRYYDGISPFGIKSLEFAVKRDSLSAVSATFTEFLRKRKSSDMLTNRPEIVAVEYQPATWVEIV